VDHPEQPAVRRLGVIAVIFALAVILAVVAVLRFVAAERQRDLRAWQLRLGIVADSRAAAVEDWLAARKKTLADLAANPSLRLYLSEMLRAGPDAEAQAGYLVNLLTATAGRAGFSAPPLGPQVPANVERIGLAGLALVNRDGRVMVASPAMPALPADLRRILEKKQTLIDLYVGPDGAPAMGFIAPVYGVQDDPGAVPPIGYAVGIRRIGDELFKRLRQPGETLKTAQSYLVRRIGARIDYLSVPGEDGTWLGRTLAYNTPELAAAYALQAPGGFAERVDYAGRRVLVTGRALAGAPWTLVRTIGANEALGAANARRTTLLAVLLLVVFGVAASLLLVWRHGVSVRLARAAARLRALAEKYEALGRFLRVVSDGQPTAIIALDRADRFRFANRRAAEDAGAPAEALTGKTLLEVYGPHKAERLARLNAECLSAGAPVSQIRTDEDNSGEERVIKSDHIPLDGGREGVLMVLEDMTELVRERERREANLRQLVTTLATIIDRRDPFSARHSARVAEVAEAIAQEIGLPDREVETTEIAGSLMNLGKILVPRELLVKTDPLSEEEHTTIREAIAAGADLLAGVDFDGPVVATIRQVQARWDGAGAPAGLAGKDILIGARILAVANAFVAAVSARAWRAGHSFDDAATSLMAGAGAAYDRAVVAALINYLDNRGGRERWARFREPAG